ncbi:MAG: hypothetical protein A2015_15675 [Spirochaetes bacterium GWF1_31_7]|nr:MAG: hypothetical protein A2Y30_10810 [Spirochaetes bacterium GWE1_32_154]OHD48243.1 MAG: hypothetical protein A2Y29_00445 [Spirochaetes bacterium GWE2_31_10]OHD50646.1 MAG: hypothetical protein A2015_15675 [Spirochaetes bacterium GWF1_31_7]OHD82127.1 MAG: hypothetical protein A2355_07990 [Spirochaetes bacterium RIFOXYB1_FULL_32_8]HBI37693.1 hypothetical protein [Spirochaetia bacterium]
MTNLSVKKILVIDDEEALRSNIKKLLVIMGFAVDSAENGEEGYELIHNNSYDLVICDVKMPVMDGKELLKKVRANESKKFVQFIFLTSNIDLDEIRSGMLLGADDYVTKPFDNKDLLLTIKKRFERAGDFNTFYKEKFEKQLKYLENIAYTNVSTKLPNEIVLNQHIDLMKQNKTSFAVFYLEIEGLDEIISFLSKGSYNNVVDEIIKNIKAVLTPDEELYFLHDSYFCIVLKSGCITEGGEFLQSKIDFYKSGINHIVNSGGVEFTFHTSGGIFLYNESISFDSEDIIRNARIAMMFSKKTGGDCFTTYSEFVKERYNKVSIDSIKKKLSLQKSDLTAENYTEDNFEIKVFFLYPQSIIQTLLIKEIIRNEYSAYILNDHKTAVSILQKYPNSILFINIDAIMSESGWEEYITEIKKNPELSTVRIGVLTHKDNEASAEKFLMQIMIESGYIKLKIGFEESLKVILAVLEANEARGKRKFIRVCVDQRQQTYAEIKFNSIYYKAKIKDISSVALTLYFEDNQIVPDSNAFESMILLLAGIHIRIKGKLAGTRIGNADDKLFVITYTATDEEIEKIRNYIYRSRQEIIDIDVKNFLSPPEPLVG